MTAPAVLGPSPVGGGPVPFPDPPDTPVVYLTLRERQILRLAANGTANRAIGRALGTCEDTVKTQMRGILRKLRAADRAQAVAVALCAGLIHPADVTIPGAVTHAITPRKDTA